MANERAKSGGFKLAEQLPVKGRPTAGHCDGAPFSTAPPSRFRRGLPIFIGAFLFLAVGGVFLPVLRNGFVEWDDHISVYQNPYVQGLDAKRLAWMFTNVEYMARYKPFTWLSYALIHAAGGLNPFGYHLAGLLFHCVNTVLLFVVLRGLLAAGVEANETNAPKPERCLSAGLGALLWAVNPLRVEAVARVTDLQFCQSLCFTLVSLWCYLRAVHAAKVTVRRNVFFWCSVAAFALAMLTYPFVFGYAAVLVVVDVYPLRRFRPDAGGWCSAAARRIWLEKLPFALLGSPVLLALHWRLHPTGWLAGRGPACWFSGQRSPLRSSWVWPAFGKRASGGTT